MLLEILEKKNFHLFVVVTMEMFTLLHFHQKVWGCLVFTSCLFQLPFWNSILVLNSSKALLGLLSFSSILILSAQYINTPFVFFVLHGASLHVISLYFFSVCHNDFRVNLGQIKHCLKKKNHDNIIRKQSKLSMMFNCPQIEFPDSSPFYSRVFKLATIRIGES